MVALSASFLRSPLGRRWPVPTLKGGVVVYCVEELRGLRKQLLGGTPRAEEGGEIKLLIVTGLVPTDSWEPLKDDPTGM